MFDVSWGETFVILGISVAAIGRKDLPKASKFFGNKVGRVVGMLQGARARADRFAQTNELQALQNELRSGLRELDTVKGELAVAASSQGLIGRTLGSTIPTSARQNLPSPALAAADSGTQPKTTISSFDDKSETIISGGDYLEAARRMSDATPHDDNNTQTRTKTSLDHLAPRSQSVAAVAEEEWEKRGIGFKTKAERGTGFWSGAGGGGGTSSSGNAGVIGGGSLLLSDLIQQNLIHDQYDRVVMEQDREMQERMDRAEANAKKQRQEETQNVTRR